MKIRGQPSVARFLSQIKLEHSDLIHLLDVDITSWRSEASNTKHHEPISALQTTASVCTQRVTFFSPQRLNKMITMIYVWIELLQIGLIFGTWVCTQDNWAAKRDTCSQAYSKHGADQLMKNNIYSFRLAMARFFKHFEGNHDFSCDGLDVHNQANCREIQEVCSVHSCLDVMLAVCEGASLLCLW